MKYISRVIILEGYNDGTPAAYTHHTLSLHTPHTQQTYTIHLIYIHTIKSAIDRVSIKSIARIYFSEIYDKQCDLINIALL